MIDNVNSSGSTVAAASTADNTVQAAQFQNAFVAAQSAGAHAAPVDPFLGRIAQTIDPQEKLALIDGFAAGYAAASQSTTTSYTPQAEVAQAAHQTSASQSSPAGLMNGYKELAGQVADSTLPATQKNSMLDNIAGQMEFIRDANPPAGNNQQHSTNTNVAPAASQVANNQVATEAPATTEAKSRDSSNGVWTSDVKDGAGEIHLGNHYTLKIAEKDESVMLVNNFTGQKTNIWGDPHVDFGADGKNEVDFHKGMSLQLADGIKITLDTIGNGGDKTYTSKLLITQDDKAMEVSGIAGDIDGKNNLTVRQSDDGVALDRRTLDGAFTFVEDESSKTWKTPGGHDITQQYINESEHNWDGTSDEKKK